MKYAALGYTEIYGRRFDSAGVAQGDEFVINSYGFGNQYLPAVGATGTNQFVVVWNGTGQADGSGIFGQRFDFDQ